MTKLKSTNPPKPSTDTSREHGAMLIQLKVCYKEPKGSTPDPYELWEYLVECFDQHETFDLYQAEFRPSNEESTKI